MSWANGGNYAGQHPFDDWVDTYIQEPTPSIGRIPKLVPPSSVYKRWGVPTPTNMLIERSQRNLPTPSLSFRVSPPRLVSEKKHLRALHHCKRDIMYMYQASACLLKKTPLKRPSLKIFIVSYHYKLPQRRIFWQSLSTKHRTKSIVSYRQLRFKVVLFFHGQKVNRFLHHWSKPRVT